MINGQYIPDLILQNVPGTMLVMRNFGGNERRNQNGTIRNSFGQRNFVVKFDEEQGRALEAQGWDIFWFQKRKEEDPLEAGLEVPVNLSTKKLNGDDRRPDEVILVTETQRVLQNEKTIGNLDGATIISADIKLTPRQKQKKTGEIKIAPILSRMYVKIASDTFDKPYDNLPWADADGNITI